jgi:hypothetical protein
MPTGRQKDEWVRMLREDVIGKLIEVRTAFLTVKDQNEAQGMVDNITVEEFIAITGGAEKTDLPGLISLLDKILQLGGTDELRLLFNLKP